MPERSSITQNVQIGVEVTPGTAVATTKKLGSVGVELGPSIETNTQRPLGQKFPSLAILGKEWAEADLEGSPVYPELPYLFSSILGTSAAVVQLLDGATPTGAYRWTFTPNSFGADTPKTFTIEQGDAVRAHRVTNALISELGFEFNREEITLDGSILAKAIEDGVTMTGGNTQLPQVPVRPTELSVYLDTVAANIGTTKMSRVLSGEWSMGGDRFQPVWVVDAAQSSFVATVEGEPDFEMTLLQEADAQGMANLTRMRAGTTAFIRLEAIGPQIYDGAGTVNDQFHRLRIDTAVQISDVDQFSDEDGVYAIEWTYAGVHDATWAKATTVEVITNLAAL